MWRIDIACQSGNADAEQDEARVETTITGVRWHINGKLQSAIASALAAAEARGREEAIQRFSERLTQDQNVRSHQ